MKKTLSLLLVTFALTAQAQISSFFNADADGWTIFNSSNVEIIPVFHSSAGNPGGYISATFSSNTSINQQWLAPAKFKGNQIVRSLGMNLSFDLQQSQAGTASFGSGDVRIANGGNVITFTLPTKPAVAPAWSSYSIRLDETGGWLRSGVLATREQIKAILVNITSIEVRGAYATNATYTSGIDNVILEQRTLLISPTITSFSPTSGTPGTSITINGNNFDPTATNNAVYFGSIAGTITIASTTQLVVTVPVGALYEKIKVINKTTGLTKQSDKPFSPTFEGGGRIIPSSFGANFTLPAGSDYGAADADDFLSLGDMDGDGWTDLISTEPGNSVVIYRNLGSGGDLSTASFASKFTLTNAGNRVATKAIDLDGDGKLDLVTGYYINDFDAGFATFRNISTPGNFAFDPMEKWPGLAYSAIFSNAVDVDADGRPDLIGRGTSGSVAVDFWIAQNISTPGNIEFSASVSYFGNAINGLNRIVDADLDNDGKPEMIIVSGEIYIAKNNSTPGSISFDTPINLDQTSVYGAVSVADFNLDGKNDLAWKAGFNNDDVHIRINTNSGAALSATDFATEVILNSDLNYYGGISIADINGDGKPDIIATDAADVGVFENIYAGGAFDANAFVSAYQLQGIGTSTYPKTPLMADLNGDNKPELILYHTNVSPGNDLISIYENKNVHTPVISLHTVSPLAGAIGSTVTITGNDFSTIASENRVWFGGVKANVISATAIEIKAEVPAGAGYERVSVVRNNLTSYYHLPFNITFSPGVTFDGTSFLPPITFPLTGADYDVEVADLNNDGKPDLVADSGVTPFRGFSYKNVHTTGAITSSSLILDDTTSAASQDLKIMDVDADGKPDILSNGGIYKNSSTLTEISFAAASSINNIRFSTWADFNADGMIDIASITNGTGNLSIYENRYRGYGAFVAGAFPSFSAAINLAKPAINGAAVSADFDNDGLVDLVSTNPTTDNLSIWRNTSAYQIVTSQFVSVGDIAAGDNPGRIYTGDLDVDGKTDLMLYHGTGTNTTLISVFHNQSTAGNIVFNKVDFTIPAAATVAHIRDLDGDGKPEILVTSESTDQFFILKNTSTSGTITTSSFAAAFFTAVTNPRGITTGDLNLDGKPEIIIASAPNSLLIFENSVPTGPTIAITSQPTSTAVCNGSNASLTLTVAGADNLTYQWQKFDGAVFNNVNNGGGYTGATTATLGINTTGNFGAGDYRCEIKGELAPDKFSNTVTLTVNVVPAAPTANGNSNCIPAAITLTASGGPNGQYRWYDTGGVIIAAQVNSTYVTPVISTTTNYSVAINNGFCESTKTSVTATIQPLLKPTLTSSRTITGGNVNLCDGENFTLTAPAGFTNYNWSNGESTQQITIDEVGSYSIILTDAASCVSPASDPVNVVVNPFPLVEITANGTQLTASSGDSYQWYQNGDAVAGATNQSFEFNVLEYGMYVVDVTDNGCTSTSDEFEYLITGLENLIEGLKVFPNPVEENLFVEFKPPYTIQVIGVAGNVIQNLQSQSIPSSLDFSSMAKGIYFLKIKNENQTQYLRIIKK